MAKEQKVQNEALLGYMYIISILKCDVSLQNLHETFLKLKYQIREKFFDLSEKIFKSFKIFKL